MNFEAFLHFQEKHRAFLEEEELRKLPQIRKASLPDLDALLLLLPQLWPQYELNLEHCKQLLTKDLQEEGGKQWIVAELQGKTVGALSFSMAETLWNPGGILHIHEIIVETSCLRKGIGRRLLHEAERIAKEMLCTTLELDCGIQRLNAFSFYQSMGFEEVAKLFSKNH